MKKLIVFLAIFTFLGNQNNDENISAEFNKKGIDLSDPRSPSLEMKYDTFKWKDGKNYIFLNVSLDYSYPKLEGEGKGVDPLGPVSGSGMHDPEHFFTRMSNMGLIGVLNDRRLVLTISGKKRFYNALTIKPTESDSFIEQMKKRVEDPKDGLVLKFSQEKLDDCVMKDGKFKKTCWRSLKLNGLFLVDEFNRFDKDESITISLTVYSRLSFRSPIIEDRRGGFVFKKEGIDLEKTIEPINPDKFDPSIPKATRAWYRNWVREQKEQNSNQDNE